FKALDNMGDETDLTKARENVRNAILNHPKLNTLVGIWSYNAPAIVDVVDKMKNRKQFVIVAFDAEPLAIGQMAEGLIDAMVVQNPYQMGYQGVRSLKAMVEDDKRISCRILIVLGDQSAGYRLFAIVRAGCCAGWWGVAGYLDRSRSGPRLGFW